jgi:hypothetical protein
MHPLKESIRFYARNIESLLLISAIVVFPFLLVHNFIMNYINLITTITGVTIVSGFFHLFLLLLFMMVIQIPFAQFVQSEMDGEDRPIRRAFHTLAEYGFSVFAFGIVYSLAVTAGMLLFLLPGLIIMILFYLTPFLVGIKKRSAWQCWRAAFNLGKKHFMQILGLVVLASVVEWAISLLGFFSVTIVTTSFGAVFFTELLLNVIVFPLLAVLFTMYTRKWNSETSIMESTGELAEGI